MSEATARASIKIDAPRSIVWEALTDPKLITQYYLGATVTTDWKVGSPISFAGEWDGRRYEDKGKILSMSHEQELRYTHWSPLSGTPDSPENYHVIRISLSSAKGITEVTLEQSNLMGGPTDEDRAHRDDFEKNWTTLLEGLKATAEGLVR
jgi:uncharacterized protein YndB with AHSA1/START domain